MKKIINYILTCTLMLGWLSVVAQSHFISAKDAAAILGKDNTVFVSMRTPSDYQKVHITGAININHLDLYGEMSMIKSVDELAAILGGSGISNTHNIILYDDGSGRYSGRMYWILTYLGVENIRIIDGGMKAWRLARKPVTKNPTNFTTATFIPKANQGVLASMGDVKSALKDGNSVLVDVRSPGEYEGTVDSKVRPGHIPSAVNLEYSNILDDRGLLRSSEELTALFATVGISKDMQIIIYCQTSVRAGIIFAALRSLDYPRVKVYDGAYLEWQSFSSNQVVMN